MSDQNNKLKRRVLGQGKPQGQKQNENRNRQPQQQQQRQQRSGSQQQQQQPHRSSRPQRHGPSQQQGQKQRHHGQPRRHGKSGGHGRPQKPRKPVVVPTFFQRDLLLIPNAEMCEGVQKIRALFDPLHSKVPAHVTLVTPRNRDLIHQDLIKKIDIKTLPELKSITFNRIVIRSDKYLWLVPDAEGTEKLKSWHEEFQKLLTPESPLEETENLEEALEEGDEETPDIEDEKDDTVKKALADLAPKNMTPDRDFDESSVPFEPHITLGYVARSKTEDEVMKTAQEHVTLPVVLSFQTLLLEEFGENQVSVPVETIRL